MSRVQKLGETMMDQQGFLGVPRETFSEGGRAQLIRLLEHGLNPESKVLEIGCGPLRVAYWLIRFLDSEHYCGIEPAKDRVDLGRRYLFVPGELDLKLPRFDHNSHFDTSVFGDSFDYFLAGSIWTHCSKGQIETTLDGFAQNAGPSATFLTSYLPATGPEDDYQGSRWVGTSHESKTPGVIRHSLEWIERACDQRQFKMAHIPGLDCDSQFWLGITKRR